LIRTVELRRDVAPAGVDALEQATPDHLAHAALGRLEVIQERLVAELAELFAARDDPRPGRRDRVEVEQEAAGDESLVRIAEDVHDVLVLNSSQRPGEERDVEPPPRRADRLRHPELD